jgi:2'-5' RNA ligase
VYSLNVPVPGRVSALASDLAADWPSARARTRDDHTLLVKRLGTGDRAAYQRLAARAREALSGTPAFAASVTHVGQFAEAADGASPVVYLAVESPGLAALHRELCDVFDPVAGMEGPDYVPHVTVARGGDPAGAARLVERDVEPIEWAVTDLEFYDAERGQVVSRVALPQPP